MKTLERKEENQESVVSWKTIYQKRERLHGLKENKVRKRIILYCRNKIYVLRNVGKKVFPRSSVVTIPVGVG